MRDELDKYQQSFQNMEGKIHVLTSNSFGGTDGLFP